MRTKIEIKVEKIINDTYRYTGIFGEHKLFSNTFEDTTEGIAEFTGSVHGLMYLRKNNLSGDVLVKNPYIKNCIEEKKYDHKAVGEKANEFLKRCKKWLAEQKSGINIELLP